MSKFSDWQKAKQHVASAKSWMSNKDKIDSQDRGPYSLKVYLGKDSIQYCGQSSAGANNYHSPDDSFVAALNAVIKGNYASLFSMALTKLEEEEKKMALAASDEVDAMLAEIKAAKGE